MAQDHLYVAGNGWVFAVDRQTLDEVWSLELKQGWFKVGSSFVSLREDEHHLFAVAYGRVHRIDKRTGELLQTSEELRGLKHMAAVFAGSGGDGPLLDAEAAACAGDGSGGGGDGGGE